MLQKKRAEQLEALRLKQCPTPSRGECNADDSFLEWERQCNINYQKSACLSSMPISPNESSDCIEISTVKCFGSTQPSAIIEAASSQLDSISKITTTPVASTQSLSGKIDAAEDNIMEAPVGGVIRKAPNAVKQVRKIIEQTPVVNRDAFQRSVRQPSLLSVESKVDEILPFSERLLIDFSTPVAYRNAFQQHVLGTPTFSRKPRGIRNVTNERAPLPKCGPLIDLSTP